MARINKVLRESRGLSALATLLSLLVFVALDLLTREDMRWTPFYLVPVALASLYLGRAAGLATSATAALLWWVGHVNARLHPWSAPWVPVWNAAMIFCVNVALSETLHTLRQGILRERAEARVRADMVSFVSHEFNNALTILTANLWVLRRTEPEAPTGQRAALFAAMEQSHGLLKRAVANFLNKARLESGTYTPEWQCVDLAPLARSLEEAFRPTAAASRIELTVQACEPVHVLVDAAALHLVLNNLLGNALKYTPEGGRVSLRVERPGPANSTVLVTVEDSGPGIAPEDRERILGGFQRTADGARRSEGFGLGLHVVVSLLAVLGSSLELRSEPGHGSAFSFRLSGCLEGSDGPVVPPSRSASASRA